MSHGSILGYIDVKYRREFVNVFDIADNEKFYVVNSERQSVEGPIKGRDIFSLVLKKNWNYLEEVIEVVDEDRFVNSVSREAVRWRH